MQRFGDFLWGLLFIALGLIIGLNALGITDINIFFDGWWTLFIIVPCFIGLLKDQNKLGNFIGLIVGLILLLAARGVLSMEIILKLVLPIIFICIGINIIFKNVVSNSMSEKIKSVNKNDLDSFCATFSGKKVDMSGVDFKGSNIDAIFGSIQLDLTNAHIGGDRVINATSIFGGTTIIVPNNVNVKVRSNGIFGGVNNKVKHSAEDAPTLYINGSAVFGGVDIR